MLRAVVDGTAGCEPTFTVDSGLIAAMPPRTAMRITGIDTAALEKALTELGATPRTFAGNEGLSLAADNETNLDSSLVRLGIVNQPNQVLSLDDPTAVASPSAAGIEVAVSPGARSRRRRNAESWVTASQ